MCWYVYISIAPSRSRDKVPASSALVVCYTVNDLSNVVTLPRVQQAGGGRGEEEEEEGRQAFCTQTNFREQPCPFAWCLPTTLILCSSVRGHQRFAQVDLSAAQQELKEPLSSCFPLDHVFSYSPDALSPQRRILLWL